MKTGRPPKFTHEQKREITALFLQGKSLKELARQHNCCRATIQAAISAPLLHKVVVNKKPAEVRSRELRPSTETALQDYLGGGSLRAVAKKYGISLSTLRYRLSIFPELQRLYRAEKYRRDAEKLQSNLQKEAAMEGAEVQ